MSIKSIRPFIGAKDFNVSRDFYTTLGFKEVKTSSTMSYFQKEGFGFYLQDCFVDDWVNNTMLFLEVENVETFYEEIQKLNLVTSFPSSKLKPIVHLEWGSEFFLHDPSNILWHIGRFNN